MKLSPQTVGSFFQKYVLNIFIGFDTNVTLRQYVIATAMK